MISNHTDQINSGSSQYQVVTINDKENDFISSDNPAFLSKRVAHDVAEAQQNRAPVNSKKFLAYIAGASVVGAAAGGAICFLPGELTKTFAPPFINGFTALMGSIYCGATMGEYVTEGTKTAAAASSGATAGIGLGMLMTVAYCVPGSHTAKYIASTVSGAINGALIGAGACYHRAASSSAKPLPASAPAPAIPGIPDLTQTIP